MQYSKSHDANFARHVHSAYELQNKVHRFRQLTSF